MAERIQVEELDRAVEAILTGRMDVKPANAELATLARIAASLAELPREEFRQGLRLDLERTAKMDAKAVPYMRKNFRTVTPYVIVREAAEVLEFLKRAFGAEESFRGTGSAGGMHAEVRIGDSMLMIGGGGAYQGRPMPTSLHLYVPDADATYRRALEAGATSIEEPVDQPYGDREAGVKDAGGNNWFIATQRATGHKPEGFASVTLFLHPRGADRMIEFLEKAFDAKTESRHAAPDGSVAHAVVRVGDARIEMGEAHGEWQPMPTAIYLYVPDADAVYRQALAAGAKSLWPPADQPYGDRNAGVEDPFGNQWFPSTHMRDAAQ